tara:strand:+ start:166 stop:891 length:726 start_codon:yes stop_codon:yes gene_type:complete
MEKRYDCDFCAQLNRKYTINNRIFYQSENFTSWPSLGPLGDGHILLLPNGHRTGFFEFKNKEKKEFEQFYCCYKSIFHGQRLTFLIGEHGRQGKAPTKLRRSSNAFVPQCVDHAHLHFLVLAGNFENILAHYIDEIHADPLKLDLEGLISKVHSDRKEYIVIGSGQEDWYYWGSVSSIESQLIRRVAARMLGCPEVFNWREFPNYSQIDSVRQKIVSKFLDMETNRLNIASEHQAPFNLGR